MADLAHRLGTPKLNPEKYLKLAADKVGTLTRIDVDITNRVLLTALYNHHKTKRARSNWQCK